MEKIFADYRKAIITGGGVLIFLLAGLITMFIMPSKNDVPNQQTVTATASTTTISAPQNQPEPPKIWYVYVTGEVKNPGVYKLSEDSRVFQVIEAAGGFSRKADKTSINLAEMLSDGSHVHIGALIPQRQAAPARIPGLPAEHAAPVTNIAAQTNIQQPRQNTGGLVDINRANENELEQLPGIGPATAKRIIEYRQSNGAFRKPEDLTKVRGIGNAKLSKIRPLITVTAMNTQSTMRSGIQTSPNSNTNSNSGGLVDINRASVKELEQLTGVGPAIAKRIADYRQKNGRFSSPEDLLKVRGIGRSKLDKMRGQILIR